MPQPDFLHAHPDFGDLIRIVAQGEQIPPAFVEKDYWIMHSLFGLQKLGLTFQLKGGTTLSKGFGIIDRFSEDIDIHIEPPANREVKAGKNHIKQAHVESRRTYYDWLAANIRIPGMQDVVRDHAFDEPRQYRSGGIRLQYNNIVEPIAGLKEGILLEAGFDDIAPNTPRTISSWAYEFASSRIPIIDNRAIGVPCYNPGYTLVEKLQTISTKFRQQQEDRKFPANFMRHYSDVHRLLLRPEILAFVGTAPYKAHKEKRFRGGDNLDISKNEAFKLSDQATRAEYTRAYDSSGTLYYRPRPSFEEILATIAKWSDRL